MLKQDQEVDDNLYVKRGYSMFNEFKSGKKEINTNKINKTLQQNNEEIDSILQCQKKNYYMGNQSFDLKQEKIQFSLPNIRQEKLNVQQNQSSILKQKLTQINLIQKQKQQQYFSQKGLNKSKQKIIEKSSIIENIDQLELNKMIYFFRNNLSLLLNFLGQKSTVQTYNLPQYNDIQIESNLQNKLSKFVNTNSKYRYRQKLNLNLQTQVKQLFKIDISKRQEYLIQLRIQKKKDKIKDKDDEDSEKDEIQETKKKEPIPHVMQDIEYWKRKNKISPSKKIFICKGRYQIIRENLNQRGWHENSDHLSPCFDFKWTCKSTEAYYTSLSENQIVNHFRNNDLYTTKSGLNRCMKNLVKKGIDIDKFVPKCYDLYDTQDFEDFLEEFKFSQAISQLMVYQQQEQEDISLFQELKIKTALFITQRKNYSLEKTINLYMNHNYSIAVSKDEWDILTQEEKQFTSMYLIQFRQLQQFHKDLNLILFKNQEYTKQILFDLVKNELKCLKSNPIYNLYGEENIWIIKPALLSRGRGIKCYNSINQIIDHVLYRDNQYIAQKYIEKSLIVLKRKFDIRLWVLVASWYPLKIWCYDRTYIRFSGQDYDKNDLSNKFVHLTNNSIIKNHKDFKNKDSTIPGNMWHDYQFSDYLKEVTGQDKYQSITQQMHKAIIYSLKSCNEQIQERQNSFEMFGYDFMIDESYNAWIIEINKSPSMDTNTAVTKDLVIKVQEDIVKVVIDFMMSNKQQQKNIDTGGFKCIYKQKIKCN